MKICGFSWFVVFLVYEGKSVFLGIYSLMIYLNLINGVFFYMVFLKNKFYFVILYFFVGWG